MHSCDKDAIYLFIMAKLQRLLRCSQIIEELHTVYLAHAESRKSTLVKLPSISVFLAQRCDGN